MRVQLAAPMQEFLSPETYNQFFTMHGTVMMFLFAVPAVEAMGILLLPQMLAARDLPFPRLSAYAFWAYLVGGVAFFCSLFVGLAPDGGWFMYPPLTSRAYSPGINADFWLLGIGFIEISAIAGAIEIIVGVLRTRAPGMSLDKMPIFAWAMLVFAVMIVIAFPSIILGTLLLELERAFNWPFFDPTRGGDALLWQHLFWFFGHPEVYIIFLPAAGMMSMMVATVAQTPLVGYRLVVVAMVATGFISFGVWAHHMFSVGMPEMSTGFFSAASMAVSVPAGIQVFAWIATLASGKIRWSTPACFVVGSILIFTMGGLSGVMVAMVPFDWQAHDTYFIVAHLHYVLIGGMVFPLFAAFYYWIPMISRRPLSERVGKWVFWLMFAGMHIAFLPMHLTGLMGMPRRVFTYLDGSAYAVLNLISTIGSGILGLGVLLFLVDVARNFRWAPADGNAGNVFGAGSLEWLPSGLYSTRSIPLITSREPLWDQPEPGEGGRGRPLLPAQQRDRPARDDRHQPGHGRARICRDHARPLAVAARVGDLHRLHVPRADGPGLCLRDLQRGRDAHRRAALAVGNRPPDPPDERRHRRQHPAPDLSHRPVEPRLVGADDPVRRVRHDHVHGRVRLPLSLRRPPAILDRAAKPRHARADRRAQRRCLRAGVSCRATASRQRPAAPPRVVRHAAGSRATGRRDCGSTSAAGAMPACRHRPAGRGRRSSR